MATRGGAESSGHPDKERLALRAPRLRGYGKVSAVLLSPDFVGGVAVGVVAGGAVGFSRTLADQAQGTLFVLAQILAALAGIVLAAHAIVVSLISPEYMLILERANGGIKAVSKPFRVVIWVSTVGVIAALLGGFLWPLMPESGRAARLGISALFGIPVFLGVWAIIGTAQLAGQSSWHFEQRAALSQVLREVRENMRQRNADS